MRAEVVGDRARRSEIVGRHVRQRQTRGDCRRSERQFVVGRGQSARVRQARIGQDVARTRCRSGGAAVPVVVPVRHSRAGDVRHHVAHLLEDVVLEDAVRMRGAGNPEQVDRALVERVVRDRHVLQAAAVRLVAVVEAVLRIQHDVVDDRWGRRFGDVLDYLSNLSGIGAVPIGLQ